MKTIIFDFDGVLHNTFEFHRGKIGEFTGVHLSKQDFSDMHTGNFFHSTPEDLRSTNWEGYRDYIHDDQAVLKMEEEIKETVRTLSEKYMLHIVSSGGTKNIRNCLKNNGIESAFCEILGLEAHRSKKEKFQYLFDKYGLAPEDCMFVTDTLGDILEANEMGIRTIAVDFGYHDRETLGKGKPFKIISHPFEIFDIVGDSRKS